MRRALLAALLVTLSLIPSPAAASTGRPEIVWVFGHSIPAGVGASAGHSWPDRYAQLTGATVKVFAVGGAMLDPGQSGASKIEDQVRGALAKYPSTIPDRVLIDAGTNDLVSHDSSTLVVSMWQAIGIDLMLQERGVQPEWMPILPMGYGAAHPDGWLGDLNARRDTWNSWLQAMTVAGAFRAADLDGVVGEFPVPTWLEPDGLHPSDAGALLVADAMTK